MLHFVILSSAGEAQLFALGSGGLGEIDSDLFLVLNPRPLVLKPQASFSGALFVHFHVQDF